MNLFKGLDCANKCRVRIYLTYCKRRANYRGWDKTPRGAILLNVVENDLFTGTKVANASTMPPIPEQNQLFRAARLLQGGITHCVKRFSLTF